MAREPEHTRRWADRGWYLVSEFGHSNSGRYPSIVRLARRGPGYLALLDEDRTLVHRNLYRPDDLRHFWRLLERIRAWKSARLFICGDPVTADAAAPGVQCYLFYRRRAFCEGTWRQWPIFIGCPNTTISLRPDAASAWFRAMRRSGGVFRLDRAWLEERLEAGLERYRCCPLVRPEPARELLRLLPSEIVPGRDRRWRVKRYPFSHHGWHELQPASEDAYADYLSEILRGTPAGARR